MELDDVLKSVEDNEDYSRKEREVVDEMKPILKKQIAELKSIISQIESKLGIMKFSQIKCDLPPDTSKEGEVRVQDVNMLLEYQLRKFSGFYCVKFTRDEHVFYFSPSNKISKKDTYAVQIINRQGNWSLGKWVMPMGVDLGDLVSEIPINKVKNIPRFLKLCKLYLDAYYMRREQYYALMDIVSSIKNCKLQSSLGYRQIVLELMGVYNQKTDNYINMIIYLFYNSDSLLPCKIKVDSSLENKLDEKTKKHFKKCLRCFGEFMLQVAFDKMSILEPLVWTKEDDVDSPLALDDILSTSEGEEGLLRHFSTKQNKSSVRRKRKKEVSRDERKKELSNVSNENEPAGSRSKQQGLQNEKTHSENASPVLVANSSISNLKQMKLKQTKINFQTKSNLPANNNDNNENNNSTLKPLVSKFKKINEQNKLVASTPLHSTELHLDRSAKIDISDITVSEHNSDMAKRSELAKDQAENNALRELLQNKSNTRKRKVKSSDKSKPRGLKRKNKV